MQERNVCLLREEALRQGLLSVGERNTYPLLFFLKEKAP